MITFRDSLRKICPPWLQGGIAEKLLYSLGVQLDAMVDITVASIKLKFPGVYTNESLAYIGRERRIRRGPDELNNVYATRLNRWLDDHSNRGGPYALLAQLHAYFAPNNFNITLVYYSGRSFSMDVDGNITMSDISWSPDSDSAKWARWWLFYEWPDAVLPDTLWGDPGVWDNGVWGSNLTSNEVDNIRIVPREWNAAHCYGKVVLLTDDTELWGYPPGIWGDPGTWGSSNSVQIDVG